MRLFISQLNDLIGRLAVARVCTAESCPVMNAGSLQYLCASHSEPQDCSAMDYMVHTVDGAQALLSNTKIFPSRLVVKPAAAGHFPNLARRLYRCLAHAWRHHTDIYTKFEDDTRCTARISGVAKKYKLLADDQMIIAEEDIKTGSGQNADVST